MRRAPFRIRAASTPPDHGIRYPPGPRLPPKLQSWLYATAPVYFPRACRRRYGEMVTLRMGAESRAVLVFEPRLVKQVLRGATAGAPNGEARRAAPALGSGFRQNPWRFEETLGQRSVMSLDGAEHSRRRRLLALALRTSGARTAEIRKATDHAIDSWPVGEPFALLPAMQSLNFELNVRILFGLEPDALPPDMQQDIGYLRDAAIGLRPGRLARLGGRRRGDRPAFSAHQSALDEFVYQEIARRRDAPETERREDVLSLLVRARTEDDGRMSDQELHDDLIAMLFGAETSASALARAFELLAHNSLVRERLEAELAAGEDAYLDAVVREALRLRSPAGHTSRVVGPAPYPLGDYLLAPRTELRVPIATIHHTGHIYPAPRTFRPERFLGSDRPDTDAWLPFGGGVRRCPGASLASIEMAVVIRRVVEQTRLAVVSRRRDRAKIILSGGAQMRLRDVRVVRLPRVPDADGIHRAAAAVRERQPTAG